MNPYSAIGSRLGTAEATRFRSDWPRGTTPWSPMNDDSAPAVPTMDVMKTADTARHVRCGQKR